VLTPRASKVQRRNCYVLLIETSVVLLGRFSALLRFYGDVVLNELSVTMDQDDEGQSKLRVRVPRDKLYPIAE
jgi:hypothetical protein